ncbi:S-type pyocin domain-containing protein [Pseudomonas syringae]|uniref:S-type pyocin domain-containing protein n=1 Tax=Pseudomonas syringae TaxID=317 RepID=UPI0009AF8E03|nr:S-type pyocin domain-containing protein [Pseudomonas syringae]
MADDKEKNILVDRGIPMLPDLGSSDRAGPGTGGGVSNSGWSFGFGSSGSGSSFGAGGSGLGPGSKRPGNMTNKEAKQLARELQAAREQQAQAARAWAEAQAQRGRTIDALTQAYPSKRVELDLVYSAKSTTLSQHLEAEIRSAKRAPNSPGKERWQLYLISKEKSEIEGLIAVKTTELNGKNSQALSFDGHNPLVRGIDEYKHGLTQYSMHNPGLVYEAHNKWESAYAAALDAKFLAESILALNEKIQALNTHYAKQEIKWREIDAIHEGYRQYKEQRIEQIGFKSRLDEDTRRNLVRAASTVAIPYSSAAGGAVVLGQSGALLGEAAAVALETSIGSAAKELGRILAIRAGQTISLTATALFYSEELGNGELTPEQRRKLFQGVGVGAEALGLPDNINLQAIAASGGTVPLSTRIRPTLIERGTELNVVSTGGAIPAGVPVINGVYDPLSDTYKAQTPGSYPRHLVFSPPAAEHSSTNVPGDVAPLELFTTDAQPVDIPLGVDTGINDCIVCFPAETGIAPQYFSFGNEMRGAGAVIGQGVTASKGWWKTATAGQGIAIPEQVGNQIRYREFKSTDAFDKATWRAIAQNPVLSQPFDEINRKRMARGFAPYAPKSTWVGERREFEFRNSKAANDAGIFFNLDQLSITSPNSTHGVPRLVPTFLPWPVSSGTWTPLIPPGSEALGPTELPIAPEQPTLYPGETTDPVGSHSESLPALDPDDVNASIPGYGEDDDLPSPDLVFAKPVKPLEVGPYNGMAWRSNLDGLDIDHIPSQQALKRHIMSQIPDLDPRDINSYLRKGPSVAIPAEIHKNFSETSRGKNTIAKQVADALDLKHAIDSNFDAIKKGLLEAGFHEVDIEKARDEIHALNKEQGWIE